MDIVDLDDSPWERLERDGTTIQRKQIGDRAGGEQLGCSCYRLPPGARSWPYHYHTGNEEALLVRSGTGQLRLDGDVHELTPGAYVAIPAGERGAHQISNDGDQPLEYLVFSTMQDPEVIVYPDSEKVGVFTGSAPGDRDHRDVTEYYRREDAVGYWTGETESGTDDGIEDDGD